MRVVCVSDTHITRTGKRRLPEAARAELDSADVVIHAGDVVHAEVLDDLARHAPVHAVLGNNDHELVGLLPATLLLDLEGVRVGVVHDAGPRAGREGRLGRRFPDADLVVFGHSHIPMLVEGEGGQRLCTPGSPTQRRMQPNPTAAVLDLDGGRITAAEIVVVDR